MGRVKKKLERSELEPFLRTAIRNQFHINYPQSPKTDEKPWGIESNDWHIKFTQLYGMGWIYKDAIPHWRSYKHYRTREDRDKALKDLSHRYRYSLIKFRVPWREEYDKSLNPSKSEIVRNIEAVKKRNIFNLFGLLGGKNG